MNTRTFFVLIVCVATLGAQGTITSLAPASVQVGGASFLMAVNGSGFTAANIVQWDGVNLTTQFASANQLAATVTASLITAAGSHGIRVRQSALVNNVSNTVTFNVNNPVPTITSFSPNSVLIGSSTTIIINGTHFGTASIARLGGTNVTTIFSSATQLQAILPASMTTTTGPLAVEVFNPPPGGGTAAGGFVTVQPLVPTLTSITPTAVVAGTVGATLTANGSNLNGTSLLEIDGQSIPATLSGSSQFSATIPAAFVASGGTRTITVVNPGAGGGTSTGMILTVINPIPTVTFLSPGTANAGVTTTLTVTGAGFNPTTSVFADTTALFTTFNGNVNSVTAVITPLITAAGTTVSISVGNPAPGGGVSVASFPLSIGNPVPVLGSINPTVIAASAGTTQISANGLNFVAASVMRVDGAAIATSFIDGAHLSGLVPAGTTVGAHTITVTSPLPGGGGSGSQTLTVNNAVPVISSISASVIPGGGSDAALTMTGAQFLPSTVADASGTPLAASFVSSSQLSLSFPTSLQRAIGTFAIRVTNPGPGGGSASIPFTVGGPAISSCAPAVVPVMTGSSPPITLTVNGGAFQAADQIRINGLAQSTILVNVQTLQCTLTGSFPVLHQPGGFAVTVTRAGSFSLVSSNAFGVPVGIAGTPDNAGTVTLAPAPPAPGQAFNLRVELPVASGPVTLIAEIPAPPMLMLNIVPGFDLVVGPGLNAPIVVTDGLGIFGPATPTFVAPYDLSSFGLPAGHGLFELRDIGAPAISIGVTLSLAAIYVDPASPIGINATHVGGPFSL